MENKILEVQLLLDSWTEIVKTCAKDSVKNASRMKGGLGNRVARSDKREIFDYISEKRQKEIQNKLYYLMPEYSFLISNEPPIFDEEWPVEDYIELCYNHYMIIIEKLRRLNK